ncbi:MBL fold metallo-hydrolase [Chitinibacteraceae bacterium HSL-7]
MVWKAGLLALALAGCSATAPQQVNAPVAKAITMAEMEATLARPGPVKFDTVVSANWVAQRSGLINLTAPAAAALKDGLEPVQLYTFVIQHPGQGVYLVDTGVSQQVLAEPARFAMPPPMAEALNLSQMQLKESTADLLKRVGVPSAVFMTHLHVDHVLGMPDLPAGTPVYTGPDEAHDEHPMSGMLKPITDALMAGRTPLREWPFQPADGRDVVDVFGDASVFAISAPGHTRGSVAYVVRTTSGPVLLLGDTCHTRWGWENGVEPGTYSSDIAQSRVSLNVLRALAARHPAMQIRFGHTH